MLHYSTAQVYIVIFFSVFHWQATIMGPVSIYMIPYDLPPHPHFLFSISKSRILNFAAKKYFFRWHNDDSLVYITVTN